MSSLNKQERTGTGLAAGSVLLVGGSVAASSLLAGYPVLGGQAVRYLAAGLLLAAWARLTHKPLPCPAGREWAWLAALAIIGLAGCSVLMIQATRVADPASVGVIIGAAPLVIIIAAAITAGHRPTRRVLLAAAIVTAGSAAAQLGGAAGPAWSTAGLLWSAGALGGVVGTSLLAAPVLPRLGALAVTVHACGLAGLLLLAAAAVAHSAGGPPILRPPTPAQLAALAYLTIAVTALVFIMWYGAMERLGVDRTGLFNGLIPVTSLAAVALTGTGTITPLRLLGALAVLAGVILGLRRAPQAPAGIADQAGHVTTWSGGLPQLDPVALRIGDPAEPADTVHVLRFFGHVRSLSAQLREHRIQVADPEVEHGLLGAGPEVAGPGLECREHRRPRSLAPQAVLIGVQAQALAIPRAQGRRVGGPHEVPADSKHTFHAAILPGRRSGGLAPHHRPLRRQQTAAAASMPHRRHADHPG